MTVYQARVPNASVEDGERSNSTEAEQVILYSGQAVLSE